MVVYLLKSLSPSEGGGFASLSLSTDNNADCWGLLMKEGSGWSVFLCCVELSGAGVFSSWELNLCATASSGKIYGAVPVSNRKLFHRSQISAKCLSNHSEWAVSPPSYAWEIIICTCVLLVGYVMVAENGSVTDISEAVLCDALFQIYISGWL